MSISLYPHQEKLLQTNPARHGIFWKTGVGKSHICLALAEKNCRTCLIVCPKMLKPKWERDSAALGQSCSYSILTKEEFKKIAATLPAYDGLIVDECHHFSSITSAMSKILYKYLTKHNIKYRWFASATPLLSTPWNIFVLARHLGHSWNYAHFKKTFFQEIPMGHRLVPKARKGMEAELAKLLLAIGTVIDMDEAVSLSKETPHPTLPPLPDVPEQVFTVEYVDLTPQQKAAIATLNEPTFIGRWTRISCLEQGVLYSDGYAPTQIFPSKKTDRIIELAQQHRKMAVFCRYNAQITYLSQKLQHIRPVFILWGAEKNRDNIVRIAEAAPEAVILIQAAVSEGYQLKTFDFIVFASLSFSVKDRVQGIGRFLRIDSLKKNTYLDLVVRGGSDEDVYNKVVIERKDFDLAVRAKQDVL